MRANRHSTATCILLVLLASGYFSVWFHIASEAHFPVAAEGVHHHHHGGAAHSHEEKPLDNGHTSHSISDHDIQVDAILTRAAILLVPLFDTPAAIAGVVPADTGTGISFIIDKPPRLIHSYSHTSRAPPPSTI